MSYCHCLIQSVRVTLDAMTASPAYSTAAMPEAPGNPNHPLLRWGRDNGHTSVTALADALGISRPRLSQIVTRKHRPAPALAVKIIRITGLAYEELAELTPAEIRAGVRAGWEKKPKRAKRR